MALNRSQMPVTVKRPLPLGRCSPQVPDDVPTHDATAIRRLDEPDLRGERSPDHHVFERDLAGVLNNQVPRHFLADVPANWPVRGQRQLHVIDLDACQLGRRDESALGRRLGLKGQLAALGRDDRERDALGLACR